MTVLRGGIGVLRSRLKLLVQGAFHNDDCIALSALQYFTSFVLHVCVNWMKIMEAVVFSKLQYMIFISG